MTADYSSFAEWSKKKNVKERAAEFAERAHKGVKRRFDKTPYFNHVKRVAEKTAQFTKDGEIVAAAYLHDTVEDVKEITHEVISAVFGNRVSTLVKELTNEEDIMKQAGKTSYLSQKLAKISDDALLIKLCDRWDNVSDFPTADEKFVERYAKSTNEILNYLEKSRNLKSKHRKIIEKIRYFSNLQYK